MGLVKYLLAILLLIPSLCFADTHNAASCKVADVTTAITASANGDTVTIPTCAGTDGTWASGITLASDKILTLQGAGYSNTVISHGTVNAITMTGAHRITGIGFVGTTGKSISPRGEGWRIDHCQFSYSGTGTWNCINTLGIPGGVLPTGLIDNNDFQHARIVVDGYAGGNFANMGTRWAEDPVLGTDNQVVIEDNTFYRTSGGGGNVVDSSYAASYAFRYNTVTGTTSIMAHGLQSDNNRGTKNWEIYGNKFTTSPAVFTGVWIRSGTGIIASNLFSGYSYDIVFDDNRAHGQCAGSCTRVGYCGYDPLSDIDGNSDATGYRCRDQIGSGKDTVAWTVLANTPGSTPTLSPAYLFMNRRSTGNIVPYLHNGDGDTIIADRDYYTTTSTTSTDCPANSEGSCTKGVGCGTLANRPTSCTPGVAYWATNQSCTDTTGMVGANPSNPIKGTLYKCNASGQWEAHYTPYTYPHPLRTEEAADPTVQSVYIYALTTVINFSKPITSTSGAAFTVAGLASALTLTCPAVETGAKSMTCTNSRTVYQSEGNGSYGYTGDKVIDAATNPLATIDSSPTAVNMSTEVEEPPALTLTISNHTGAVVTSTPSGLNCGSTCSADFENGTVVTVGGYCLPNYTGFTVGGEHCASNGTVTVNGAKSCTATCTKISPDVSIGSGSAVTLGTGAVGTLY